MKADFLYGTPFEIEQKKEMYHFNSDTEFLGRMLEIEENDSVLDIGCNSGALLLFASLFTTRLTGIDLFEEVIDLADENMKRNHVDASLYVSRVQDFKGGPFDIIICNPPYFNTKENRLKNENLYKRAARHEDFLPLTDLFTSCERLLKQDGILEMVHRASRIDEITAVAKEHGFYLTKKRISFDHKGGTEKACILYFEKTEKELVTYQPAFMDDRDSFARKKVME